MIPNVFSDSQIDALASLASILKGTTWALIGASAIRCRFALPRPTFDLDLAVGTAAKSIQPSLKAAGWTQNPRGPQQWKRAGVLVDLINATDDDISYGVTQPKPGFVLTVVGFDLAYAAPEPLQLRPDLTIPVAPTPAIVLLKMIAWLDRPSEREKDLQDLYFIWAEYLAYDDERRFEPAIRAASLEYDDQGTFVSGWELATMAHLPHRHWVQRFLDQMRDDECVAFARFVRVARVPGDEPEERVRALLRAFELGFTAAVEEQDRPPPPQLRAHRRDSLANLLHDAIDRRLVVRFYEDGKLRVTEPHVLGVKDGATQLLAWQLAGESNSGPLPGWRRFNLRKMTALELTGELFSEARVTRGRRHSAFDRHIAIVRL